MEDKIYLSVILTTYNNEKYIGLTIESILNQTYPYFEFIIINDGSTDNTSNIIQSYQKKDGRIVYIDKQNTGNPDSVNIGISKAKYDWIARIDGDDIAMPNRFAEQVSFINDNIDIIGSNATAIDEEGIELYLISMPKGRADIIKYLKKGGAPFINPSVLIRKSLLEAIGGYDINFKRSEDLNIWLRCSHRLRDVINIQGPLLKYRVFRNKKFRSTDILNAHISYWLYMNKIERPLKAIEFNSLESKIPSLATYKLLIWVSKFLSQRSNRLLIGLYSILSKLNHISIKKIKI